MENEFSLNYGYLILISFLLLLLIFIYFKVKRFKEITKKSIKFLSENTYIILFLFPLLVLINKHLIDCKTYNDDKFLSSILNHQYLVNLSYAFVATGSALGINKYISGLHFFKKQMISVVASEEFGNIITQKISEANFTPEHLSSLNNIDEKWRTLTLCKYQKKFPELMSKIKPLLQTELLDDDNLSCYYDNVEIRLDITLTENDDIVHIKETSQFHVIPTDIDQKIPLKFTTTNINDGNTDTYTKLITSETVIDNELLSDLITSNKNIYEIKSISNDLEEKKEYTINLNGKNKYSIIRVAEMKQHLKLDRLSSSSTSKIMNNFKIQINTCPKTDIFFSSPEVNKLQKDTLNPDKKSYFTHEPLLPGDLYNIFIFRKEMLNK
ncbi:hypothetical protein [Tenacibaculum finnmarkense]|uniref:hypothetical protein n=2 Tax=Tenacibaculum finnmarkense TaxID=2781243 RepID=UPI00187B7BC9|nr:hypothetical protein [Tenacibaculum finnmarkense]MBE7660014.1 hypothetical protein [Tenacibaculum finnmarkense genomovar finnmarkense]MCG8251700.1 hypothetical protein [Tenacibaculum finnmarkense genomovar finnmarkense]MCG8815228.1 hypothetical protein [Tenacibaculum finnmarkense]MCG8820253.1 hypothetical protein [Tenacibaculum finnmarkense]MCG8892533.1 hypothetical protein [Tenacibaculum finnmarkense]